MTISETENQIQVVKTFQALVETPFRGTVNALCWQRNLIGDFSEIVSKFKTDENITTIETASLSELQLSEQGQLARETILNDLKLLKDLGAAPTLNLIEQYDRDENETFFHTDVYSFHVDRSPVPTDTFLCTYHGDSSEILPNSYAVKKVLVPEIRQQLKKRYQGNEEGFESFLKEHFFDLHYLAKPHAPIMSLGLGHLWRLSVDHPESQVLPCIHRAPQEKSGQKRLLLIC